MEKYPALYLPQLQQFISLARFGNEACILGRDPQSSVQLLDLTCSRRQFSVVASGRDFQIANLSQSVPTLRNGEALSAPAVLQHNDRITCGNTIVVFLAREEAGTGGSAPTVEKPARGTGHPPGPEQGGKPATERGGVRARVGSGAPPLRGEPTSAGPPPNAPPAGPPPARSGPRQVRVQSSSGSPYAIRHGKWPGPPATWVPDRPTRRGRPRTPGRRPFRLPHKPRPPSSATSGTRWRPSSIRLQRSRWIATPSSAALPDPGGITLDHPRVSRRHAEVRVTNDKVFLRDLGSSNGTFLNGERITAYRELRTGDRIDIGPYSFKFTGRGLVQSSREGNLRVVARNLTRTVRSHSDGQMIRILDDVALVVEPGEFVCILGSSGSGKSTLMQALSARKPADQGQVFLNEVSLYANFQTVKQSIALVPQKDVLHEDLSLEECIRYTAKLRLPPDTAENGLRDAVGQAIERVDLKHRASTPIKHLSGGQKKRAALANETVSKPELLFLDEVTSGLDEGTDWEMMRLFRRMADDGMTVICVTHTVANVEDFCHKIIIMTPPGVLAYYGLPAGAKRYFELEKLGDVYRKLAEAPGTRMARPLPIEQRRIPALHRRAAGQRSGRVGHSRAPRRSDPAACRTNCPEVRRQFGILTSRFFEAAGRRPQDAEHRLRAKRTHRRLPGAGLRDGCRRSRTPSSFRFSSSWGSRVSGVAATTPPRRSSRSASSTAWSAT